LNKCIMDYRLPQDIQGHANNIERTNDRVTTNLKWKVNDGEREKGERCHRVHGKGGGGWGRRRIKVDYIRTNSRKKPRQIKDWKTVQSSKMFHRFRGHDETLGHMRIILNEEEFLSHRYKTFPFLPKNMISSG